ncbi:hypothetical protein [Azospirillum griseum]|uniref:Uncharacterized protein n=1 Tax=Azospirillum griseum TaxID=2496639 RepID=A0A431VN78_9PROT|nr:hypothetical protein [Azospirillum griseum]RTR24214.1 hypothetical protein EJ903_00020 [Azospirillum griseum]
MDDMGDNGQVLPAITTTDIIIIDNEPRVTDVKLAAALGYAKVQDLRQLAERHRIALERFGRVSTHRASKPGRGSAGGRPSTGMAFNKKQALYLGGKTDLPAGVELLIAMVEVFDAVTSGKALPPPPPAPALTKADLDAIDQRARHAAGVEESRVRRALTDAALDALRQGRPVDAALRTTRLKRSAPLALPPPEPPAAQSDRSRSDLSRAARPLALTARFLALPAETQITFERVLELLVEINRVLSDLWDATGEADLRKPIGDMLTAKADQWRAGNPTFTRHH